MTASKMFPIRRVRQHHLQSYLNSCGAKSHGASVPLVPIIDKRPLLSAKRLSRNNAQVGKGKSSSKVKDGKAINSKTTTKNKKANYNTSVGGGYDSRKVKH
jgi:hypothetical protein